MATHDDKAQVLQVSRGEALALKLGPAAARAAGHALRDGGYKPSSDQFDRINTALSREVLASALVLAAVPLPGLTEEDLDEAAERSGYAVVREVMGPPPMVQ